jgi:hypothetical protein
MRTETAQRGAAKVRRLLVAWRNVSVPSTHPVGWLEYDGTYRFRYLPTVETTPGFRPFLSFPDPGRSYESELLFPFFAQRVVDRRRPDYQDYLDALALPRTADPLEILGRSGGWRRADKVQVVEVPGVMAGGSTRHVFLVHGTRFAAVRDPAVEVALARLSAGDTLHVIPEPDNPVNSKALEVSTAEGARVGWVPDLLIGYVSTVLHQGPATLVVTRVNGPDLPSYMRLVVELSGTVPSGYEPFGEHLPGIHAAT